MPERSCASSALAAGLLAALAACEVVPDPDAQPPAERTAEEPPTEKFAAPPASKMDATEIADLERMCAAVDHDYVDGTLSDYFADTKSETTWGRELQARADESTTPGRELLRAARSRGWTPQLGAPSCVRLFDYLDDVE